MPKVCLIGSLELLDSDFDLWGIPLPGAIFCGIKDFQFCLPS